MEGLTFDVGLNAKGFNSGISSMESMLGGLGGAAKSAGAVIATALGGAAVISAIDKSIEKFHEMDTGLREISTLVSGNAAVAMEKYGASVESIMRDTGSSTDVATSAVYNFVSAFGEVEDSAEILQIASKQSVAGVTDVDTAVNFLATTIFGFGKPATEEMALEMANLGQIAIKQGRTTLPQLESAIGKVIPTAKALNITEKEFFATMAAGTKSLGTTSEVSTRFQATLTSMLKPSKAMSVAIGDYAEELGMARDTTADNIIQAVGFQDALEGIARQANGNSTALAEMFGSSEALNFVLAITGDLASQVSQNMELMENSTGALDEAYNKMAEGSAFATKQLRAEMELLNVAVGDLFASMTLPIVKTFTVVMGDITEAVKDAKVGFAEWSKELDSLETFDEKLEFTLDTIVSVTGSIVDAAGGAIDKLADYLRVNVLGVPADESSFDLGDISTIVKAGVTVIQGTLSWFGSQIDAKADATRAALGLEGDANNELDIGDIAIIAKAKFDDFAGGVSVLYNEMVNAFTGSYPDGIDLGEQKATVTALVEFGEPILDAVSYAAAITLGVKAIQGIGTALSGTKITVGNIFLAIGTIKLSYDVGSMIGDAIVEEMNKKNIYSKTTKQIESQLKGIWNGAFDGMIEYMQSGPQGDGLVENTKWVLNRWFLAFASEMELGAKKLQQNVNNFFVATGTWFRGGLDSITKTLNDTGTGTVENLKGFFNSVSEALTPPDLTTGGLFDDVIQSFNDVIQSFNDFFDTLFGFESKLTEAAEAYNKGVQSYNQMIEGTDLAAIPELKIPAPTIADDFDSQASTAVDAAISKVNELTGTGQTNVDKLTITFDEPDTSNVVSTIEALTPQKVGVEADLISADPLKNAINAAFEGARNIVDNLKVKVDDILVSGELQSSELDKQIAQTTKEIQALKLELGKGETWWDPQMSANIDALQTKLKEMQAQKISIGVTTEGLEKANVLIGIASFGLGLLNQGAEVVVNAVIDEAKSNLEQVMSVAQETNESTPSIDVSVNGMMDVIDLQWELEQVPPVKTTTLLVADDATTEIESVKSAIDQIPASKTFTIIFDTEGKIPDFVNFNTFSPQFQPTPTPGGGTTAPITIPAVNPTNININFNGDTVENNESSRQKITEMVYEGLREAGVVK